VQVPPVQRLPAAHVEQAAHADKVVKPVAEKKPLLHVHWVEPAAEALLPGQAVHDGVPAALVKVLAAHTERADPDLHELRATCLDR
jgi:hypothetical protein